MKKVIGLVLAGSIAAIAACSSSSTSTTPGASNAPGSAVQCKNAQVSTHSSNTTCSNCIASKCSAQGTSELGSDPNSFGGACGAYLTCLCNATDLATISSTCGPKNDDACKKAESDMATCQSANCSTECSSSSSTGTPDGGTTTNPTPTQDSGVVIPSFDSGVPAATCADLASCCTQISDAQTKQGCDSLVGAKNDSYCAAALAGLKSQNLCK